MKYYKKLLITNYNYWPECDIFLDIINSDDGPSVIYFWISSTRMIFIQV